MPRIDPVYQARVMYSGDQIMGGCSYCAVFLTEMLPNHPMYVEEARIAVGDHNARFHAITDPKDDCVP